MLICTKKNVSIFVFIFSIGMACQSNKVLIGSPVVPVDHDILLIVNYQHAEWYKTMDFLKGLYKPYFPSIVFFGPKPFQDTITYSGYRSWHYEYTSIAYVLEQYPGYKGYLWINDDLIISPWKFYDKDKGKIWISKTIAKAHLDTNTPIGWMWWPMKIGRAAVKQVVDNLEPHYLETLEHNCGKRHTFFGYSDIVYIPQQYRGDFIKMAKLCIQHNVFLEIALPTICGCIAPKENYEVLNGLDLWSSNDRAQAASIFSDSLDFIHPVKISKPENRQRIKAVFEQANKNAWYAIPSV